MPRGWSGATRRSGSLLNSRTRRSGGLGCQRNGGTRNGVRAGYNAPAGAVVAFLELEAGGMGDEEEQERVEMAPT